MRRHPSTPPQATITGNLQATTGTTVQLSGTSSTDPDGDVVTYAWSITSRPAGSNASLASSSTATSSLTPDVEGNYVVMLVVTDSRGGNGSAQATIAATRPPNTAPRIDSFTRQPSITAPGETVTFRWTVSDAEQDQMQCVLDVTGTGLRITIEDCGATRTATHAYAAAGTFRPRLTVSDGQASATASLTHVVTSPFSITVREPAANALVPTQLRVVARVNSPLEVREVRARVADRVVTLVLTSTVPAEFSGMIDLGGLQRGEQLLEIRAEDITGALVFFNLPVIYDDPPALELTEPRDFSVARPRIRVVASCTDDGGECQFSVRAQKKFGVNLITLHTATGNSLDVEVDLSGSPPNDIPPGEVEFFVQPRDSRGQTVSVERFLFLDASPALVPVADAPGPILDVRDSRMLFLQVPPLTSNGRDPQAFALGVLDRVSGTIEMLPTLPGRNVASSESTAVHRLTPQGALFVTYPVGGTVSFFRLHEWVPGLLQDLGELPSPGSLNVDGDYAIWGTSNGILRLRNLSTREDSSILGADTGSADVASNGVVAYQSTDFQIRVYAAGSTSTLTSGSARHSWVLTDGQLFVYTKQPDALTYAIVRHDGTSETTLRAPQGAEPLRGRDYQVHGRWVAFSDFGNLGQRHVFTIDPTGAREQRTFFGASSDIDRLGDSGALMLVNDEKRYLSTPGAAPVAVNTALGTPYQLDGQWYVAIGRSLFRVQF